MALLAIAQAIPMILIGPWAGVIVDKVDRKYAMVFADLGQAFAIMLIPFTVFFSNRVWWIIAIAFCNATFARFFYPARGASIPKLIEDKKDLLAANSLSVGTYQVSALIGPILAALGIWVTGGNYDIPFVIDGFSFLFSAFCILMINRSLKATDPSTQKPLQDLITGALYITRFLPLLYLLVVFSVLMFAGGASMILLIPYLEIEFGLVQGGEAELIFAIMVGFSAALGIILAILLSRKERISNPVTLITLTLFLAGIILVIFGSAPNLWVVGLAWIGFGAVEVLIGIPLQTLAQETVPDRLRGKIFSFINLSITVSQIIGMGIIGVIASTPIGIRGSLILSGIILVAFFVVGIFFLKNKQLETVVETRRNEMMLETD